MTGTLSGFLVYRLQDSLKKEGFNIPYDTMIKALTETLIQLDNSMEEGETIDFPSGKELIKASY